MRVLLTNDDGIFAPGLMALWSRLSEVAEVTVVAPEAERSCCGHSLSLRRPVLCHRIERDDKLFGYALEGTPADCVKIGLAELLPKRPDLVIAGINPGRNVGIYVLYSGTVAAALEGAMAGIPSMAVSMVCDPQAGDTQAPAFDKAANVAMALLDVVRDRPGSVSTAFNINLPADIDGIRGVKVVPQSRIVIPETYVRRNDPRGRTYFWVKYRELLPLTDEAESDRSALADGFATVTPLRFDLTDDARFDEVASIAWQDVLKRTLR